MRNSGYVLSDAVIVLAVISLVIFPESSFAQPKDDVLQRLEAKLDSQAKELENLAKENAALRDKMKQLEFARKTASLPSTSASTSTPAKLPIAAQSLTQPKGLDAYASAPAAYFSWTGWYMGMNQGGNWGTSATQTTVGSSAVLPGYNALQLPVVMNAVGAPQNINTSGFTGGLQGGYNWQSGNWLVGGELDFEYFRSAGSNTISGPFFGKTASLESSVSSDWLFTARTRLGMVSNNWLFYGTGGLAVTHIKATWRYFESFNPNAENASLSSTKTGWVIGGGIETMLPEKWIIGAEYLYVHFGSVSVSATGADVGAGAITNPFTHTVDLNSNIVRGRVSKLF